MVEAALLLEEHYQDFCDQVWYIHTDPQIRIRRLEESRGYTREKAEGIIASQATEEYFRAHTDYVIENNNDLDRTYAQIREEDKRNMRFCSIASGSSGNCIYVGTQETHLLIDAGISGRRIEKGLNELDLTGKDVDGILITHEHSDHIGGLGVISRKYQIPIYTTGGTADAISRSKGLGQLPQGLIREIREDEPFQIKDLKVNAFTIPHDAAQPVGFRIEHDSSSVGIATDLGKYNDYIVEHLQGLDALLLEANHDIRMLQVGKYPYYLKQRILGDRGHLSNENAGRLLCRLLHDNLKAVFLGHLSKENNYEQLAYETVCSEVTLGDNPYRSGDFRIQVARRDCLSQPVII